MRSALFVIGIASLRAGGRCAIVSRDRTYQRRHDRTARSRG